MYRIKTDIRQYKCESIDKVEKLIRNWVIRPNDLIYHSDERDWLPIGEHPSFEKLFGILEEREAAEPDTVVTDDHPLRRNGTAVAEEPTQITERPEFKDDDEDHDESLDSRETDIFDADQIAESLAERDRADAEKAAEEAAGEADEDEDSSLDEDSQELEEGDHDEDSVSDDTIDDDDETHDEIEVDLDEDSDASEPESTDEPLSPPEPPEGVEPPVNDEITVMTDKTLEMMKVDEDGGEEEPDEEKTNVTERPTDDETTNVTERPTDDETTNVAPAPSDDDETQQKVIVAAPENPGKSEASKGVGRHDLPEEFFATNEISGPVFEESARVIDDLAAMEAEREAAEESIDDEWDAIGDDLDATDEKPALGLRDTDEFDEEEDQAEAEAEADETPIAAADEWDEDVSAVAAEETDPAIAPVEEFISDGYKMPLPFEVGPDEKDVAMGLTRSTKSDSAKDAVFPYPQPKKRGEVHARVYYFSEEERRDLSIPIVVGIILICAALATLAAVC